MTRASLRPGPALLLSLLLSTGCAKDRAAAPARKPEAAAPKVEVNPVAAALAPGLTLDPDDPATCAPCHGAVVAEWQESLHARAHHGADPVYAALRTLRTQKQGPQIPGQCANCHNPRDTVDHESKAAKLGVTCATCHQLTGVALDGGKAGVAALVVGPAKTFRGPHDFQDGVAPLHATGAAVPALADGKTLCLACHAEAKNPAGLTTCNTGVEYAEGKEARPCTECHMPTEPSPSGAVTKATSHKSHRFPGPHQAQRKGEEGVLAQAVALSGRFEAGKLVVRVENKSGHSFPTGFPARMVVLDIRALDASGKEVYKNIASEPMKEHPEAVFNKGYVDAEGKPTLAAFATRLVRDNRLKPAEVRELSVVVPPAAVKAELSMRFFLGGPQLWKALEYQGPETKPVTMARVTVSR
jgi:Cytochrome c554 and c-prime